MKTFKIIYSIEDPLNMNASSVIKRVESETFVNALDKRDAEIKAFAKLAHYSGLDILHINEDNK